MTTKDTLANEKGFALLMVLLLSLVVGALAMSAITLFGNASIINASTERDSEMEQAAMAGTEMGRTLVNRRPALYPDSGYLRLPDDSLVLQDAMGRALNGYNRAVYAGPTGIATGQFGVFGTVLSVVEDGRGSQKIYRREMVQESFAKYAYFTDKETSSSGSPIYFAPGDQLFGPVHSNDVIRIMNGSGGPIFHGPVSTYRYVSNEEDATFKQDLKEGAGRINLPEVAELAKLEVHAQQGNASFASSNAGGMGEATTRIEFIAIDIDGDGLRTGPNEGFFKVYHAATANSSGARWVVGGRTSQLETNPNCGHRHYTGGEQHFYSAPEHDLGSFLDVFGNPADGTARQVLWWYAGGGRPRCYLGGSDSLSVNLDFRPTESRGGWERWSGSWVTPMPAAIAARADSAYLVPLGRGYNPNFKGVIHVDGKVAISGELRGRVTLATTGDIVIADDVQYATDPSAATCEDILGIFAGGDVVMSDNTLNAPTSVPHPLYSFYSVYRSYDNTTDEIIHGVLLTLGSFTVANYGSGSNDDEDCQGADAGRGCLYLTGGIIQDRRGAVGQSSGGGLTGYLKRYSYDQCAATSPPPYFPTTGYFTKGGIYEVDPTNFDVGVFFDRVTAGG